MDAAKVLRLPCGLKLNNRLVKAAMSEQMADKLRGDSMFPTVYGHWSKGGWGAMITGNVMVDRKYLGSPKDVAAIDDPSTISTWSLWSQAAQQNSTPTILQLNHPGRQSPLGAGDRGFFDKTIAPSAVPLRLGNNIVAHIARSVVFGTPREMSVDDIETVIHQFTTAAVLASKAGFKGVEIHAAHGYLLAQFLSSKSNYRTDDFGGTAARRVEVVLRIIRSVRRAVGADFCIGVKVNSADFQESADIEEMMEQLELISKERIDFLELSGGSYEDPQMLSTTGSSLPVSERTQAREGFFLEAGRAIRARLPTTVLLITGGFRSRSGVENALQSGACVLVGIGRPAVQYPHLPARIVLNSEVEDADARFDVERAPGDSWITKAIPSISAGNETRHFGAMMSSLATRI